MNMLVSMISSQIKVAFETACFGYCKCDMNYAQENVSNMLGLK